MAYIRCTEDVHRKLKIAASTRGTSMQDLAEEFIEAGLQAGAEKVTGNDAGNPPRETPSALAASVGMENNGDTGYRSSTTEIEAALNGVKSAVQFLESRLIPRMSDVGNRHGVAHEATPNQTDATVAEAARIAAKAKGRIASTEEHTGGSTRTDKEDRKAG